MDWMRRNRWTTWWVMAWLSLSIAVANASPLMSSAGALVCSASGTKWVEHTSDAAPGSAQKHTWHCSLCLPFVAVGSSAAVHLPIAALPTVLGHTPPQVQRAPAERGYLARGPPGLSSASATPV